MDIWDRRRKNLAAVLAYKGIRPVEAARRSGLSINTVGKFIRGETHSMRHSSLDKLCAAVGLASASLLDTENPLSETKNLLYAAVHDMTDEQAQNVLNYVRNGYQ
jgi:DNA-binding Xre family transcriptional regulator